MGPTPLWTVSLALKQVNEALVRIEADLANGRMAQIGETLKHAKAAVAKAEEWVDRTEPSGRDRPRGASS